MSDENEKEKELRPPTLVEKQPVGPPDEPKVEPGVDVSGNLTPITRKEVEQIDAVNWDNMNLAQLHHQLTILEQRVLYAQQYSNIDMVTQIERGINQLRVLILKKSPNELKLI